MPRIKLTKRLRKQIAKALSPYGEKSRVARLVGCSRPFLSMVASGEKDPSEKTLAKLCDVLGLKR